MTNEGPFRIVFSASPSRAAPVALDGATVSGRIYIFLEPSAGVLRVKYWSDDPFREDEPGEHSAPPFDLLGTGPDGLAAPFDTSDEENGVHELEAEPELPAGPELPLAGAATVLLIATTARYTIANAPDEPVAEDYHTCPGVYPLKWPMRGTLGSPFGKRPPPCPGCSSQHPGIDIKGDPRPAPVFAACAGQAKALEEPGYGHHVVIDHGGENGTLYGHLDPVEVQDQAVAQGERIGVEGRSGRVSGTHLHFELRKGGEEVDTTMAYRAAGGRYTLVTPDTFFAEDVNLPPVAGTGWIHMAATPDGNGYWLANADGRVASFGNAHHVGDRAGAGGAEIVGIASAGTSDGYWLAGADGSVFPFGSLVSHGSAGDQQLNVPIAAIAAHPSGEGYWLVAADGGLFRFGKAGFFGSPGGQPLHSAVVDMAVHPSGEGYWLLTAGGRVFHFGAASFQGDLARQSPSPLVGLDTVPDGNGYRLLVSDGDLHGFGSATVAGQAPAPAHPENRYTGIHSHPERARGFWLTTDHGPIFGFDARFS